MAFETISLGTQPAGTGGDTARTAFEKVNRNFIAADVLAAAMSQAQFEANRNANKELYAASGWVSFGNHESGKQVNECKPGLYTALTTPNTLLIGKSGGVGGSKADHGVLHIAGVIFHLPLAYPVKLAEAPDGKTTYNKSTGAILNHATAVAAFNAAAADPVNIEVVTDRIDMWGFEAFPQEITIANPEIYPQGIFSDVLISMNAIQTSDSARPISYFGWLGTKAKKLDYFSLTDYQKKKVLADPMNNLYYSDDGKLIQWVLRGREFAGAGNGDWDFIDYTKISLPLTGKYLEFSNGKVRVQPQGVRDSANNTAWGYPLFSGSNNIDGPPSINIGVFSAISNQFTGDANSGVNGECYFIVCGTVKRINKSVYHPVFNYNAASMCVNSSATGWSKWFANDAKKSINKVDYFTHYGLGGLADGSAYVGSILAGESLSGHPLLRFYDAIYPDGDGGVCRDMRYSANEKILEDCYEAYQVINCGKYRGFEKRIFTQVLVSISSNNFNEFTNFSDGGIPDEIKSGDFGYIETSNAGVYELRHVIGVNRSPSNTYIYWDGGIPKANNPKVIVCSFVNSSVGGAFLQTDVIAPPNNILNNIYFSKGWYGRWINKTDANQLVPTELTRKSISTPAAILLRSDDSWLATASGVNVIENSVYNHVESGDAVLSMIQYQVFAKQTELALNEVVYKGEKSLSNIFMSSDYMGVNGALIAESLIGKVLKNNVGISVGSKSLISSSIDNVGKLTSASNFDGVTHQPLTLSAPANSSPAFKAISYPVVINDQMFIQCAATELKHNGSSWSDDGKQIIVDGESTKPNDSNETVKVVMHRLKEPLGWVKNIA